MLTNFAIRDMPRAVKTAPDVFGFCGRYYRFEGDIGVCPRCVSASVTTVSPEERQQMQAELALVLAAPEQGVSAEGWPSVDPVSAASEQVGAITMPKMIVLGAGVCGLAAGMMLHRDGHDVTILERDPEPAPRSAAQAWERWPRDGVIQFRQPHFLLPRGRMLMEDMLPDVTVALEDAGGLRFDLLSLMPPSITDRTPRSGDERFQTLTARRPVLEQVLRWAAHAEPGLEIRSGVHVRELVVRGYDRTPHISGVRTGGGEHLRADLIVDATGRGSQLTRWLAQAGVGPVIEEVEESGFVYYTRYFRARGTGMPAFRAPIVTDVGTFSVLTCPPTTARGRSPCSQPPAISRSSVCAIPTCGPRWWRRAPRTSSGSTASPSPACSRWPGSSTASDAYSSTDARWRPAWSRSAMRWRVRTPRAAAA